MMRNEEEFDKLLSRGVKKYVDSIEAPDKEEMWADFEKRLNLRKKNKSYQIKKKIAAVAAVIIIFFTGVMVGTSNYANANFNFLKGIKNVFGNITNISLSTQQQDNKSEIKEGNAVVKKKLYTVKEANEILDYSLILPKYVPQNYELVGVYIRNKKNDMSPVEMQYLYNGSKIIIKENPIIKQTAISHNVRNAETKKINVNGSEATLIYYRDLETHELIFHQSVMYYEISGPVSEDEIIKIATSIPNI